MTAAASLRPNTISAVPRTAPAILLNSKLFIERLDPRALIAARKLIVSHGHRNTYKTGREHLPRPVKSMIENHNTIVVIPARMASTRLPGKPLADIHGLPMI